MNSMLRASTRDEIGLIEVREALDGQISLSFGNHTEQSSWHPGRPEHLAFSYYRALLAGLILHPQPRQLHLFGLGGGTLARFLLEYSDLEIHAHDCRPALATIARDHFGLDLNHPRLALHFADITAADWSIPTATSSDLMLLDLFDAHGMTPLPDRSLAQMADHLSHDGLVCINVWRNATRDTAELYRQMSRLFHRQPLVMHVPHRMNSVICYRRTAWDRGDLQEAQRRLKTTHPAIRTAIAEAWQWLGGLPPGI